MLRRSAAFFLSVFLYVGRAQNIAFEMRSYPDSPIVFPNSSWTPWRAGSDYRMFVTIQNKSEKAVSGITFEAALSAGARREIVSLERVSLVILPQEKKRVSVTIMNVLDRARSAAAAGESTGNPVLSVVSVEFVDGALWHAP